MREKREQENISKQSEKNHKSRTYQEGRESQVKSRAAGPTAGGEGREKRVMGKRSGRVTASKRGMLSSGDLAASLYGRQTKEQSTVGAAGGVLVSGHHTVTTGRRRLQEEEEQRRQWQHRQRCNVVRVGRQVDQAESGPPSHPDQGASGLLFCSVSAAAAAAAVIDDWKHHP